MRQPLGDIPVVILDGISSAIHALMIERDENTCRDDFTPSEKVRVGEKLEVMAREEAKARQQATQAKPGNDGKNPISTGGGNLPALVDTPKGDTRDLVGAAVGMSGKSYQAAKHVVENGVPALISAMGLFA